MACLERFVGQNNIALPDTAGDFVDPAMLAVGISLLVSTLYVLTRPVVDRRSVDGGPSASDASRVAAREIVRRHGRGTLDYFALRDDKQFFFFRDSLVAYAVYGGVALISPDPIGPEAERIRSVQRVPRVRRRTRVDHRRHRSERRVAPDLRHRRTASPLYR